MLLGQDGDFYNPVTWEIWAWDEWGISRMWFLEVFQNKSSAVGAKGKEEI